MVSIPTITGLANVDDQSIDVTLAALPAGATEVLLYRRTYTGDFALVHTFSGAGSWNDDNAGGGFSRYTVNRYLAQGHDGAGDRSAPSKELFVMVGTRYKFTMGALVQAIKDMVDNDPDLLALGYQARETFVDPAHVQRMVYILPGVEVPQVRYATGLQETQLPVTLLVLNKSGHGRTAWNTNHQAVERLLKLLDLNYKWGCNAYDTEVNSVDHYAEGDGSQPQLPVVRIDILARSQYAKYIS